MPAQIDPVLDDPGELIRFWLWHEKARTGYRLSHLGRAIKVQGKTISAWLDRYSIPTTYWNPIARFFNSQWTYRDIEDQAKQWWVDKAERRGYVPLYQVQVKRRRRRRLAAA